MKLFQRTDELPRPPLTPAGERTYLCAICRDLGILHHYRPGIGGVLVTVVAPCLACAKGNGIHLIRAPGHPNDGKCGWAMRLDGKCPLCGAHPGEYPPTGWIPRAQEPVTIEQLSDDRVDMAQHWAEMRVKRTA